MKISFRFITLLLFVSTYSLTPLFSQTKALKYNLNDSGTEYFQVTFLNQVWLRYNQANPGSTIDNELQNETLDIGLRRTRIQLFGQITPKVFLYFQFGQNNFNAVYNSNGNRKQAAFFHDALCEYKVSKNNVLKLGGGLTVANGLSRFTQASIGTIMSMDVPVFAQATVDQTDLFNRKLSLYARGQVGRIDYRLALTDPFPIYSNGSGMTVPGVHSSFASKGRHKQYQAYLMYQFFEHEGHTTPYMTGTYLGKKKVFNIGAGFIHQKNAMWHRVSANDSIQFEDMQLLCIESFLDLPLNKEKGTAMSVYAGYFNTQYGKNYLRYNGLMNPMNGSNLNSNKSLTGQGPNYGNAYPMFGTGELVYGQVGYLMPKNTLKSNGLLMPYATFTYSKFDRLNGLNTLIYNAGINWLIQNHHAKISLDWQSRPTYGLNNSGTVESGTRRNQVVLQYQISI